MIFIADFIACSKCFGHHYAHHQELENIIQVVAAARKPETQPSAPHHTDNLKTKAPNTTGSNHLYNTLELLIMGIMLPETCWVSNKICNKNNLLHLVGIYFHICNFTFLFSADLLQKTKEFKKLTSYVQQPWLLKWCGRIAFELHAIGFFFHSILGALSQSCEGTVSFVMPG